jgi:transposase-like protein
MKEKMLGQKNGRKKYSAEFKDRALALSDRGLGGVEQKTVGIH